LDSYIAHKTNALPLFHATN